MIFTGETLIPVELVRHWLICAAHTARQAAVWLCCLPRFDSCRFLTDRLAERRTRRENRATPAVITVTGGVSRCSCRHLRSQQQVTVRSAQISAVRGDGPTCSVVEIRSSLRSSVRGKNRQQQRLPVANGCCDWIGSSWASAATY